MITIQDFMETVQYRITEGSDYGWQSFGSEAYSLSYWNGDYEGHAISMVFDRKTQTVYTMDAVDYSNNRAYRWINPDYVKAYRSEVGNRNVRDEAWDDVPWTDLEVPEDFLTKARAIVRGEKYDIRVQVPIELEDHELFQLMTLAHKRDITLNQLVEEIINLAIQKDTIDKNH